MINTYINISKAFCFALLLLLPLAVAAEVKQLSVSIGFPVNRTEILPQFGDNAEQLANLESFFSSISPTDIDSIRVNGYASPEGDFAKNLKLAQGRAQALINYIVEHTQITKDKLYLDDCFLSWEALRPLVEESDLYHRDNVLILIDLATTDRSESAQRSAVTKLQQLDGGAAWAKMKRDMFPKTRLTQLNVYIASAQPEPEPEPEIEEPEVEVVEPESLGQIEEVVEEEVVEDEPEYGYFYLKTNGIGWAMLVSNIAIEWDLGSRWSLAVPIYYSGLNYMTSNLKFRTFNVQPELRYWLGNSLCPNSGWYVGAHFGLGYFNYALNGDWRIQDYDGKHPALGGGLALGYRLKLHRRWMIEFGLGAGVYHARYDKFENHYGGQRYEIDKRKTWFGIDQAAVSVVWTIPYKKDVKGGSR